MVNKLSYKNYVRIIIGIILCILLPIVYINASNPEELSNDNNSDGVKIGSVLYAYDIVLTPERYGRRRQPPDG